MHGCLRCVRCEQSTYVGRIHRIHAAFNERISGRIHMNYVHVTDKYKEGYTRLLQTRLLNLAHVGGFWNADR